MLAAILAIPISTKLYFSWQLQQEIRRIRAEPAPASSPELEVWYAYPQQTNAADVWMDGMHRWKQDMNLEDWLPSCCTQSNGTCADQYDLYHQAPGMAYPKEMLDKIATYAALNQDALGTMAQAAHTPDCRWRYDFNQGREHLYDDRLFGDTRHMARIFGELLRQQAQRGDWVTMNQTLEMGLKLGNDVAGHPSILGHLVGVSIHSMMFAALEMALPHLDLDTNAAIELRRILAAARRSLVPKMKHALIGDRAMLTDWNGLSAMNPDSPNHAIFFGWTGIQDRDRRLSLECMGEGIKCAGCPDTQLMNLYHQIDQRSVKASKPIDPRFCYTYDNLSSNIFYHIQALTQFDTTLTALACEQYRLDHGQHPTTLNDLVPGYLPQVPPDLFDSAQPLRYKIEVDRFTVYSVGRNQTDDGGDNDPNLKHDDIAFTLLLPNAPRRELQKK